MRYFAWVTLISWLTGWTAGSLAQCPSGDSLYRRVTSISNANLSSEKARLELLLSCHRAIEACPDLNDSSYCLLLRRIGAAYGGLSDYSNAIEYTYRAIDIIRSNLQKPSIKISDLPICYYNLQLYYDSTKQEAKRREAIDSCIAIDLRINGNYAYSAYLLQDKIVSLFNDGDYALCSKYASVAEKVLQNSKDTGTLSQRCYCIIFHVNALIFLKRYQEAEQLLTSEMKSFRQFKQYRGSIFNQLAIINIFTGSYEKALASLSQSADAYLKSKYWIGYTESLVWRAYLHAGILNQPKVGLEYYKKARQYADSTDAILVHSNIGKIYAELNVFDSAFDSFQRAFNMIRPGCNERTVINEVLNNQPGYKSISYVTNLLINKGDAYLRQFKINRTANSLDDALYEYFIADQLLSNLQSIHVEIESKLFWRDYTRRLYEDAIEACYLLKQHSNAFYFFEKGRAAILNAQLNEQRWIPEGGMKQISGLRKEIYNLEKQLREIDKNSPRLVEFQKKILEKKQQLEGLRQQIKSSNPLYFENFIDTTVAQLSDVQQKILKDHQAIVELFAGDSAVYVLVIESNKTSLNKISRSNFDSLSRQFTQLISNLDLLNSKYDEFLNCSSQLYKLMFEDVHLPSGRIIISPDGKYFPFEALIESEKPFSYFIENHAVSYTYSVRYLMFNSENKPGPTSEGFLGIAPQQFNPSWQLPILSGSEESLSRIKNNFTGMKMMVGGQATRNNFLRDFFKYRIIQLYTHATDSSLAGEPMIYFSDSTLSLSELIYAQKPFTKLIVLSACQTGSGKLYNGEGVFNFNRGFAAIGVPSSISNLWQVENQSTYALTELFYQYLAQQLPADIALQKAKKDFMRSASRRNQLPYLWAAPILVGDSNYSADKNSFSWKWLFLLTPVLLLFIWWLTRSLKKKT